jgi:tyrosyl-tRNA synthetase
LCRGADAAALAAETARKTFEEGASGGDLPSVDASGEISVIDALVALNFVASKKEARRRIQGGGARVDGDAVTDEEAVITAQAAPVKISAGKKKHGLINFV